MLLKLLFLGLLLYFVWKAVRLMIGLGAPPEFYSRGSKSRMNPPPFGGRPGRSGEKDITEESRIIDEKQEDDR